MPHEVVEGPEVEVEEVGEAPQDYIRSLFFSFYSVLQITSKSVTTSTLADSHSKVDRSTGVRTPTTTTLTPTGYEPSLVVGIRQKVHSNLAFWQVTG